MHNLTTINLFGNIFLVLNIIAGLLWLHWAVVLLFAVIHTLVRLWYLKTETNTQAIDTHVQQTVIAPPAIRQVATVISGGVMAVLLYVVGYALRYGYQLIAG